jgi:Tol biopolymer transport system component
MTGRRRAAAGPGSAAVEDLRSNITRTRSAELEAQFSPDGSKIVFVSNEENNADIWS